jgi:hypothetical protein
MDSRSMHINADKEDRDGVNPSKKHYADTSHCGRIYPSSAQTMRFLNSLNKNN